MAQTYTRPIALERMEAGLCPECGVRPEDHVDDIRFWVPRNCTLLPYGVRDRIARYERDRAAAQE